MSQTRQNGTPAYKRIQEAILKRIEAGQLRPGDVVDSERELAKIHRVSLMTARHALADLEREGTVERRRGAGTFVAPPKIHFNKLMSFTEQMASRGLTGFSRMLSCTVVDDEPEISALEQRSPLRSKPYTFQLPIFPLLIAHAWSEARSFPFWTANMALP